MRINNIHGVANARGSVSSTLLSVKETQASSSVLKGQKDELTLSNRSVILDSIPSELVDTRTNSVHIQPDIVYSLGQVNGKMLNFRFLSEGGIETNFSPMIKSSESEKAVTEYQIWTSKIYKSYTQEEHAEAVSLTRILKDLYNTAENKMSIEDFNKRSAPFTSELLNSIGIDGSKAFSMNGVKFRLEDGMLYKL